MTRTHNPWWALLISYWSVYGLLFLIGTENFIVSPMLPAMAHDTGIDVKDLAWMVTSYALTYAVLAPMLGTIADRFGRWALIILGGAFFVGGNLSIAGGSDLATLILSRGVMGLGGAMAGPAMWAYIADSTAAESRGQAMGMGMGAFSLGQVIGIPLGGVVAEFLGWRWVFGAIGLLIVPLILHAGLAARSEGGAASHHVIRTGWPMMAVWSMGRLRFLFAITFLFQAGNLATYTYLGAFLASSYYLSPSELGLVGVLVGAGSLFGALAGGKLCDLWHARGRRLEELVVAWSVLLAIAIVAATHSGMLSIASIAIVGWFIASGAFVTTQQTLITLAAPSLRATTVAWNNSIMYLGAGLGVWSMGVASQHGLSIGVVGAVLALAAASTSSVQNLSNLIAREEAV